MKTRLSVVAILLLGACATTQSYDYSKEPDPRKLEYVIGVNDHLAIQVWKNPDLSGEVVVRPDGTITLPLIGDLVAEGRTPTQLRAEVLRNLEKFVRGDGAVVTVAITAVNSYSFTVSGKVEHPGVFQSQKYVTVLEAMQLAGGPNRFASPRKMQLMRRDRSGQLRVIPVDYAAILAGKAPAANLVLLAGDQLHVP